MGAGQTQLSGELEDLVMWSTSTPTTSRVAQRSQSPILILKDVGESSSPEQTISENRLNISYEQLIQSSYSEVVVKTVSFTRADCYDVISFNNLEILESELENFDPLDYSGFTIAGITKGGKPNEKCFVERSFEQPLEEGEEFKYVFPEASAPNNSLIIHPPSEVWGYDGRQLMLGVVASCHMAENAWYTWFRDGTEITEGKNHCCLPITSPGSYTVEVQCGDDKSTTEPVLVTTLNELERPSSSASASRNTMESDGQLPVVEKKEISFSTKDEIGRGSFGIIYRGVWAGTDVAVKHIKVRNARRLRSVVETEARLHSMVRHPNIVQIMAISYLKNSVYLVAELIEGHNLEELIFDNEISDTFTIKRCNKLNVGKQLCQAVAYLHNLKPPLIHRDIKPANVLVAQTTHVTKLCDMGLSKLKSAQSLSQTTSTAITGTPSYMAPECLLEKKNATVQSDVWSLACTLVELFTETDCWEQLLDGKTDLGSKECSNSESELNSLMAVMRKRECPRSLESLPTTVGASLQHVLNKCFDYDIDNRVCAIDIVNAFP